MRPWLFGTALLALGGCSNRATAGPELPALEEGAQESGVGETGDRPPEITVLGNEDRWSVRFDGAQTEARALIDCPFWWGCDVLVSFDPAAFAVNVELEVQSGERVPTRIEGTLSTESVTHLRAQGLAHTSLEPGRYALVLRLAPGALTDAEADLDLEAIVAWQGLGAWGASETCRHCDSGEACGAGSTCLARGVCFDGGGRPPSNGDCVPEAVDRPSACAACQPVAADWTDPSVAVRDTLDASGSRCWLVRARDDAAIDDEQMHLELRVPPELRHDGDVWELRLFRDVAACADQRPLAVAFAHGDAHELRWLETAAPDDGTFVVEARKRSGPTCGGSFSLSVSGLH